MGRSWKKPGLGGSLLYSVLAFVVSSVMATFARLEIARARQRASALHELPPGGLIVVANHTSIADGVFLALAGRQLGRPLRLLGTAGIIEAPLLGRVFRALGFIAVHRHGPNPGEALRPAADALRAGEAIALYPEGRITRNDRFWPERAKTGAVRLAVEVGVPIIPLASVGAHQVVGRRRWLLSLLKAVFRRPNVTMRLGAAFSARDYLGLPPAGPVPSPSSADIRLATDEMMRQLVALVAGLRHEAPPDPLGVPPIDDDNPPSSHP